MRKDYLQISAEEANKVAAAAAAAGKAARYS